MDESIEPITTNYDHFPDYLDFALLLYNNTKKDALLKTPIAELRTLKYLYERNERHERVFRS